MVALADVFRRFAEGYLLAHGAAVLPSHRRAIADILAYRTGVSDDGRDWHPARRGYLVPTKALARLVRSKLKSVLEKRRPDLVVPPAV